MRWQTSSVLSPRSGSNHRTDHHQFALGFCLRERENEVGVEKKEQQEKVEQESRERKVIREEEEKKENEVFEAAICKSRLFLVEQLSQNSS